MRKFLKIIASSAGALLLLIIGAFGAASIMDTTAMGQETTFALYTNLLPIIATIGGFGGAIICGILTLKNFFKIKTKKDKKD